MILKWLVCAFCRSGRASGYNFTTVTARTSGSVLALLKGLKKYRKYGVVIQAFNEKGPGPMAAELVTQTLEDGKHSYIVPIFTMVWDNSSFKMKYPRLKHGKIQIFIKSCLNFILLWRHSKCSARIINIIINNIKIFYEFTAI